MPSCRLHGGEPFRTAVIHGGPGAPGSLEDLAKALAGTVGVVEPFLREKSVGGQVQELLEILQSTAKSPYTLVGHSWGAWLAYIFAVRFPSLVQKVILVGSGPFQEHYVKELEKSRLERLSVLERAEFDSLLEKLGTPGNPECDAALLRLAQLVSKADNYEPIEELPNPILPEAETHNRVWDEARALRRNGKLMLMGREIQCPVVAIHGDYDPHPAAGVQVPLSEVLSDFRFYLLERCGHSPWNERYAKDRFLSILRQEIAGQDTNRLLPGDD